MQSSELSVRDPSVLPWCVAPAGTSSDVESRRYPVCVGRECSETVHLSSQCRQGRAPWGFLGACRAAVQWREVVIWFDPRSPPGAARAQRL